MDGLRGSPSPRDTRPMVRPTRVAACLLTLLTALGASSAARAQSVPGEVIVRFAPGERAEALQRADVEVDAVERLQLAPRIAVLQLDEGQTVADAVAELSDTPGVVWAQRHRASQRLAPPNDPRFLNNEQYGLSRIAAT